MTFEKMAHDLAVWQVGMAIGELILAVGEQVIRDGNIQAFFEETFGDCCEVSYV